MLSPCGIALMLCNSHDIKKLLSKTNVIGGSNDRRKHEHHAHVKTRDVSIGNRELKKETTKLYIRINKGYRSPGFWLSRTHNLI